MGVHFMQSKETLGGAPPALARKSILGVRLLSLSATEIILAVVTLVAALGTALNMLSRGIFFDEFFTLAMTRPNQSFGQFFDMLKMDAHPALHFLIIWFERALGVESVTALRASNLIGVPVVAWALWFSVKSGGMTRTQAWMMAVLAASSTVFFEGFAETRGYFLLACASVSTAAIWLVVLARIQAGQALSRGLLVAWALPLAMQCNLHYFGMLLGGVMTALLLVELAVRRSWADAARLAAVSLAAAAPAVILVAIQSRNQPHQFWILTTPGAALELFIQFLRSLVLNNLVAFALMSAALLAIAERGAAARREARAALLLAGSAVIFLGLLFVLNAIKPMIIPRYLTPAIGPIIAATALLATGRSAPRWALAAVTVCALLAVAEAVATRKHFRDGWDVSANAIAAKVAACPGTRVYVSSHRTDVEPFQLDVVAREEGYRYYAKRLGLKLTELKPGDVIPAGNACPNLFWAEHAFELQTVNADVNGVLKAYSLKAQGPASLEWISSAGVVAVGR